MKEPTEQGAVVKVDIEGMLNYGMTYVRINDMDHLDAPWKSVDSQHDNWYTWGELIGVRANSQTFITYKDQVVEFAEAYINTGIYGSDVAEHLELIEKEGYTPYEDRPISHYEGHNGTVLTYRAYRNGSI